MASSPKPDLALFGAVDEAVRDLVCVRNWGSSSYVSLPLFYPSGAPVSVRVTKHSDTKFQIDDGGFAYRELESVGAHRSFRKAAPKAAETEELQTDRRTIFVDASVLELGRAICDVGVASWQTVHNVFSRIAEGGEEIEEYLRDRLTRIFGPAHVEPGEKIVGSSTQEWDVSAILKWDGERTVFQAVIDNPISVYRNSTAFHDLAALPNPPRLVAVVKSREALGPRLSLLSQVGRVIQSDQSDEIYKRAAGEP